ncbi:MAG TPA: transcription repressor NadR [Firmicutes bacterium]|nr:transcription repressor NadR [Bacillota bacterium]
MNSNDRRHDIEKRLVQSNHPIKGSELAKQFEVSRQVIVQDIALLRAKGIQVVATPSGYMITTPTQQSIHKMICCHHGHDIDEIKKELDIIVGYGGKVLDVIVEHPVYGEIRAMLNLRFPYEVEQFIEQVKVHGNKPLSLLTSGEHYHTIEVDSEEMFENIKTRLEEHGFVGEVA